MTFIAVGFTLNHSSLCFVFATSLHVTLSLVKNNVA